MLANWVFFLLCSVLFTDADVTFLWRTRDCLEYSLVLSSLFRFGFYVGVLWVFAPRTLGITSQHFYRPNKQRRHIFKHFVFPSSDLHGGGAAHWRKPWPSSVHPSMMQKLFIFIRAEVFPPQNCSLRFGIGSGVRQVESGKETAEKRWVAAV